MKLLIVDDSALVRSIIKEIISRNKCGIVVVGEASNGKAGVELNRTLNPDLITMDLNMPIMDGLEAIQIIMQDHPVPILLFSSAIDAENSFKAIKYGAVDVMKKPEISQFNNPEFYNRFIEKLLTVSKAKIKRVPTVNDIEGNNRNQYKMVVMGASTGGPKAISYILNNLPAHFPIGISLVQHLETGFDESYVNWLNTETQLKVRLAQNDDEPKGGEVVVAPADKHIVFREGRLYIDDGPRVLNQKPSVDVLFKSAAGVFGNQLIGILLTGIGSDGARGCVEIRQKGGFTIVQDEETSDIFGMPKSAIEMNGADKVLPLDKIPPYLLKMVGVI